MKDNRKTMQLLLIFTVIFSIMGGSLAYWNWNTTEGERTNVVFTVTSDFSCAADGGGNISSGDVMLAPTTCTDASRAIKRKVTVTPTLNRESMTLSMDLWLTINDLGEGLKKSNNFRYVLTTSSNSCEEGTIMASGNFKGRKEGNKVNLLTNELYTETPTQPEEYWLYIWLDAEETSSSTMNQTFNLSLGGQCEEVETLKGEAYALLFENGTATDWSGNEFSTYDLMFIRSETPINADSEYDGKVVAEVYSNIETTNYSSYSNLPWYEYYNKITSIEFKDTIRPISTAGWFYQTYNSIESSNVVTEDVDLSKLDTSQVTNMTGMFSYSQIKDTESISNMDVSKVKYMDGMFYSSLVGSLDLSNWDVSNVTDMGSMFAWAYEIWSIGDVSNWDTSQVTDMSSMFSDNYNAGDDISNWNVSNVTDMGSMFSTNGPGSNVDLSNWDTSSVTNMSQMFYGANVANGVSNWDVSSVTSMGSMFEASFLKSTLDLSGWNVQNVRDMSYMFNYAQIDGDIDLSGWNVSKVTDYTGFNSDVSGTGTLTPPNFGS